MDPNLSHPALGADCRYYVRQGYRMPWAMYSISRKRNVATGMSGRLCVAAKDSGPGPTTPIG